jgi:hypothetical protein
MVSIVGKIIRYGQLNLHREAVGATYLSMSSILRHMWLTHSCSSDPCPFSSESSTPQNPWPPGQKEKPPPLLKLPIIFLNNQKASIIFLTLASRPPCNAIRCNLCPNQLLSDVGQNVTVVRLRILNTQQCRSALVNYSEWVGWRMVGPVCQCQCASVPFVAAIAVARHGC